MDTITTDVRTLNGDVKKILSLLPKQLMAPQTQRIPEHIALPDVNDHCLGSPSCRVTAPRHAGRSCKRCRTRRRCMPCVRTASGNVRMHHLR